MDNDFVNLTADVCSIHLRCEIRSAIKFFILRRESAAETHRQLVDTHGLEVMSRQHVRKLVKSLKESRTDTQSGRLRGICLLGQKKKFFWVNFTSKSDTIVFSPN
ncbi:hypothetical protein AAG570_003676 [Ranatra chinensis]|uniref:Mos1 transposase HTH domain-containing protein n=1 Tax=Ranatra chinensis TaxID=642074 RepID=A0ABD0Y4Z4_9HEMI